MTEIVLALGRSLRTLGRGRVWLLFFGPAAVALVIWIALMVFALESLIATLVEQPPMTWLAGWGAVWLAKLADYPELARVGKDSVVAGAWNSIAALMLYIVGMLLTLPLWLVPGLGLVLPILWMAWLTRRTFAFDALTVHATDQEWRELRRRHSIPLLVLGVTLALLAHIPLLGLLTPTLAALAYSHFCLEALRGLRQGALVAVIDEQPKIEAMK